MELNKRFFLALAIVFTGITVNAQSFSKYWVKLKDKVGTPYTISNPSAFLTPKAVLRRTTYSIPYDQTDLPVTPSYVAQIDAITNVKVLYASKWLNSVAVQITTTVTADRTTAINAINSLTFVASSAPVNRFKVVLEKVEEPQTGMQLNRPNAAVNYYGGAYWQNKQLRVDCIHYHGYRGQGMTIAVLDAGFSNANTLAAFDSLFARGGVLGTRDFVAGGNSVYEDDSHGMSVLSCMAALVPSVMVGSAPRADYWLLRTEDAATETPSEEYNWIRGAEFADSVGVDILTTSLGYTTFDKATYNHTYSGLNGKTYAMSIAATMASRKGMFVLNSAGNDGGSAWQFIGVPADADSICTVGAVDSLGAVTGFSSKGPTSDGRIKPDLCARGGNACVATTAGNYGFGNGTSFSCPVLAGAIACFWQKHSSFNNMKVLDTLRKTASFWITPNNSIGWGIPDMCALPVGLNEQILAKTVFSIYPNPFSSKFTVKLVSKESDMQSIQIYSVVGALIKEIKTSLTEIPVDLSAFANGVYYIKVNTKTGSAIEKVIKE